MHYRCLVVDDELDISQNTSEYFNMFDLKTAYVTGYEEALLFLKENTVDLILLDINLGAGSGFELCKRIRETMDIPIFFLSARTSDDDVLTALNIGGDDYIKKPYSLNILLAKVKAMLKRYDGSSAKVDVGEEKKIQAGQSQRPKRVHGLEQIDDRLSIDHNYHQIQVNGEMKKLKEMEYQLLSYLIAHKNQVIPKNELFDKVWNNMYLQEGTLSVHIRHLREKIEPKPNEPNYIKTVWGIGYVFETER
ncbi:response regulator transcription factor [Anaerosporobacter faecicola]|uniref:response regulator transcription factor n=1 Tax=Anaerosporobacter faecicola TaxID=2718714 RepID=UPI00143A2A99|nr:response regulator transcription factor [Anaerosporobacter faecicola]